MSGLRADKFPAYIAYLQLEWESRIRCCVGPDLRAWVMFRWSLCCSFSPQGGAECPSSPRGQAPNSHRCQIRAARRRYELLLSQLKLFKEVIAFRVSREGQVIPLVGDLDVKGTFVYLSHFCLSDSFILGLLGNVLTDWTFCLPHVFAFLDFSDFSFFFGKIHFLEKNSIFEENSIFLKNSKFP